jgi:phosphocarrier protein
MKARSLTVPNKLGIHARPAALIVRKASEYQSEVFISNGVDEVNAKASWGYDPGRRGDRHHGLHRRPDE